MDNSFVIVPNYLRDAINQKLDEQFKIYPEAEQYREAFFNRILAHYDIHGEIPDVEVRKLKGIVNGNEHLN